MTMSTHNRGRFSRWARASVATGLVAVGPVTASLVFDSASPEWVGVAVAAGCPPGMANVLGRFCIDRYEASVDIVDAKGRTVRRQSPYQGPKSGSALRARSRSGVVPQAYLSQVDAAAACAGAGKRLCTDAEWVTACKGRTPTRYPYGDVRVPGRCNDAGVSPLRKLHGGDDTATAFGFDAMNDPRLNQVPGSLARTGAFTRCRNGFGVYDMVGNLHEWTASPSGTFRGGYYLDTRINGEGCEYQTTAHSNDYHDYSIGFRCCLSLGGGVVSMPPRSRAVAPSAGTNLAAGRRDEGASDRIHVVASGETLSGIATRYRLTVRELCSDNGLDRQRPLQPGQKLRIKPRASKKNR